MKSPLLPFLTLLAIALSLPLPYTRSFPAQITTLQVSGPFSGTITQGFQPTIQAQADSQAVLDLIHIQIIDHRLKISLKQSGMNVASLKFSIVVGANVNELIIHKAAKFEAKKLEFNSARLQVTGVSVFKVREIGIKQKLTVDLEETSKLEIDSGTINELLADVRGVSNFIAPEVRVKAAKVTAAGVSKVQVHVERSLEVKASGISEIKVRGRPVVKKDLDALSSVVEI